MNQKINFGEIWLANLNPNKGSEPGKTRPVLVIQNQSLLDQQHPSTLIVPLTTNLIDNAEPLRVRLKAQGNLAHDSDLLIDQLRAIDNSRLIQGSLTCVDSDTMRTVQQAILEVIDYWQH